MSTSNIELEITRLKIRCEIHELLLARLLLGARIAILGTTNETARMQVLSELETAGEGLGQTFFGSELLAGSDGSEKDLYRQELRDIVDHMKKYVNLLVKQQNADQT